MRDFGNSNERRQMRWEKRLENQHRNGHVGTGILLMIIGVVALLKTYVTDFPRWLFSWQLLLITLGLFVGFRHRFKGVAWFILIVVGGTFLTNEYFLEKDARIHMWPIILISVGIFFIIRSRQKPSYENWCEKKKDEVNGGFSPLNEETYSQDDFVDATCIFSGTKKNILSKDFKGGDIVNVFGGTELNLTQADINGVATLELTNIFGGTKLIVPSNWSVKSEAVTIFGGIEDKRQMSQVSDHPGKLLLIKGTVIFGGIDIKSF